MTYQEKNIAIAIACGWEHKTQHPKRHGQPLPWMADYWRHHILQPFWKRNVYPRSYCHDLNHMREAEITLFGRNDWSACEYENSLVETTTSWAWHATAEQRADSFLQILNRKEK